MGKYGYYTVLGHAQENLTWNLERSSPVAINLADSNNGIEITMKTQTLLFRRKAYFKFDYTVTDQQQTENLSGYGWIYEPATNS